MCSKGVPQGMAISPILFNTVLDYALKKVGLLHHILKGWADDLVFVAYTKTELCTIINKLKKLDFGL